MACLRQRAPDRTKLICTDRLQEKEEILAKLFNATYPVFFMSLCPPVLPQLEMEKAFVR